jgi:hypothetical protein
VGEVAEDCVLAPIAAEIERYREACLQVRVTSGR